MIHDPVMNIRLLKPSSADMNRHEISARIEVFSQYTPVCSCVVVFKLSDCNVLQWWIDKATVHAYLKCN